MFWSWFESRTSNFDRKKKPHDGPTDGRTDGPTDGPTDGRTDGWTDRPSYRDAFQTDASKNNLFCLLMLNQRLEQWKIHNHLKDLPNATLLASVELFIRLEMALIWRKIWLIGKSANLSFLGSGPKGQMSCRTQWWISLRPSILMAQILGLSGQIWGLIGLILKLVLG